MNSECVNENSQKPNFITAITAVAVSVIALATLVYQISQQISDNRKYDIREWQKTVIYKVLLESPTPLSFIDLYGGYLDEVKNKEYSQSVPSKEIRKDALFRILLELREYNIIGLDNLKRYYVCYDDTLHTIQEEEKKQIKLTTEWLELEPIVLRKIMDKGCQYTGSDLYLEIKREYLHWCHILNSELTLSNNFFICDSFLKLNFILLTCLLTEE